MWISATSVTIRRYEHQIFYIYLLEAAAVDITEGVIRAAQELIRELYLPPSK